ncbi:GNAT family N-acetyltransferase [Algoriphagus hitonicola]|uniref:Acetyltransferase (GNAT) family protein n=1 Tax=Algoriphagus hitonicola TaxID=435880 RepID=A0A1I2XTG8_9BACT|nr:GNAT family N-acetyltransferase [Algoriphagus hitonicola]SFH16675.1 Acetyltransferase (GNAT) family protein [Algoriphagus hitonicola]
MINPLSFDTQLFGYPVGAVDWQSSFNEEDFLQAVSDFKLVYLFSDNPLSFSSSQIRPVDVKIVFKKDLSPGPSMEGIRTFSKENPMNPSQQEKDLLRFLALESGAYSRFKTDPRLTNNEFEKLYELWIEQAISTNALIIGHEFEGMITYSKQNDTGKIGLVAVHPDHRQKGWGKKLVYASEKHLFEKGIKKLEIPTQESNYLAMKLYERMGYQIVKKTYIYHYWSDKPLIST